MPRPLVLEFSSIQQELSEQELWRLAHLRQWLIDRSPAPSRDNVLESLNYRVAPSLITRSEAELFGISFPRFAYRAVLQDDQDRLLGFVNLRRIRTFAAAVGRRLSLDPHSEFMSNFDRRSRCIADSFFDPSSALPDHTVIVTSLAHAYGEIGPQRGVPFVTHFPIGGGLCAQAICFQANALCYEWAKGVFGVAEITHLASEDICHENDCRLRSQISAVSPLRRAGFLNFSGLAPSRIEHYFRHPQVGLNALAQRAFFLSRPPVSNGYQYWKLALLAYLRSGFPVIVPVNANGMGCAYANLPNRLIPPYADGGPVVGHCVLAVGFSPDEQTVIVNDPATFPFMDVEINELYAMADLREQPGGQLLIPVTPPQISRYLLDDDGSTASGLMEQSRTFRVNRGVTADEHAHSDWLLLDLKRDNSRFFQTRLTNAGCEVPELLIQALTAALPDQTWVWVQTLPQARRRWIWDACQKQNYWLAEVDEFGQVTYDVSTVGQLVQTSGTPAAPAGTTAATPAPASHAIQSSVISSFSSARHSVAENWLRTWQTDTDVELYVFMQPDVDDILQRSIGYTGQTMDAVEMMANFSNHRVVPSIVDRLTINLDRIVALATFIPEISSPVNSHRGRQAAKALRFVALLALEIRKRQTTKTLRVIELVAGSRIEEIYSAMQPDTPYPQLVARIAPDNDLPQNVLRNLWQGLRDHDQAKTSRLSRNLNEQKIAWCLELEPGPLYALRDLDTLNRFANAIHSFFQSPDSPMVGFNLDIAHWMLAGLQPGQLLQPYATETNPDRRIVDRIGHCHVAGHDGRAHFGDIAITQADQQRFLPWIELIRNLSATAGGRDFPFSDRISLEFEAARDVDEVRNSLGVLNSWL